MGIVGNFSDFSGKEKEKEGFSEKAKNYPQCPQTDLNAGTELDTDVGSLPTNDPQYPQTDHKIQIGSTVKIHCKGSMRDGEIGTVISIDSDNFAQVRLHKQFTRRELQIVPVPLVKEAEQEYYLELID